MKNRFLTLLTSAVGVFALSACGKSSIVPKGKFEEFNFKGSGYVGHEYMALNQMLYNIAVGESKSIETESFPNSVAASDLVFTSSNSGVASVDETGKISGVSKGIADIEVKTKDGSFTSKVRVSVSEKSSSSGSSTVIDSIASAYESKEKPSKVISYEYVYERYYKEGVLDHGMDDFEVMAYNSETGYFLYEGPSVYYKTPYGAPEVKDGKWIMYPVNYGLMTRLMHVTPTGKNFMDLNTASYESYDKILRDIINFFFTSGEAILTNTLEDYEGLEDFNYMKGSSSYNIYAINSDSLYYETSRTGQQEIDAKTEIESIDIPAGTVCDTEIKEAYLNSGCRNAAYSYQAILNYKLGEENWSRDFVKTAVFDSNFEEERYDDPKEAGFNEVDSLYDL